MKYLTLLLIFVPLAVAAELMHASPLVIFVLSALAIVPLSGILGQATEELAGHTGPTAGGLINATLGNFAELVIAGFALRAGLIDLVKASITGSILGNLLLVLGAAQLAGGIKYKTQKINPNLAGMSSTLLVVAVLGLVMPAVFHAVHPDPLRRATVEMSVGVALLSDPWIFPVPCLLDGNAQGDLLRRRRRVQPRITANVVVEGGYFRSRRGRGDHRCPVRVPRRIDGRGCQSAWVCPRFLSASF